MRVVLAFFLVFGLAFPAFGEETPRTKFTNFFEQILGEWNLTLQDLDENGAITYEGDQIRTFEWGIAGRFVEEKAYFTRDTGEKVYLGLMLFSLEEQTGQTLMVSFWPRSPRRWAEFTGEIINQNPPTLTGVMSSYRTDGVERKRRVEIFFPNPNQILFLSFAQNAEGEEYLVERLTYNRVERD